MNNGRKLSNSAIHGNYSSDRKPTVKIHIFKIRKETQCPDLSEPQLFIA